MPVPCNPAALTLTVAGPQLALQAPHRTQPQIHRTGLGHQRLRCQSLGGGPERGRETERDFAFHWDKGRPPGTNPPFLLVPMQGERGPTLLIVAVYCSQMVSSSMSNTWREVTGKVGVRIQGSSYLGGEPGSDTLLAQACGLVAISPETSVFSSAKWT